jgi:hypothetical protein
LSDKDFKVKSNLVIGGLTTAGPIVRHTDGTLTSHTSLPIDKGGTGQTSATNAINALLPLQTDNSTKFLTTDGSAISWEFPAYTIVAVDGTPVTARKILNFVGATITDNSGNNQTNVTIGGSQYSQVLLTQDITGMNIL